MGGTHNTRATAITIRGGRGEGERGESGLYENQLLLGMQKLLLNFCWLYIFSSFLSA